MNSLNELDWEKISSLLFGIELIVDPRTDRYTLIKMGGMLMIKEANKAKKALNNGLKASLGQLKSPFA